MSGESADKPESFPARKRALRVPISDIPRARVLAASEESEGNGQAAVSNVVELYPPSGVTETMGVLDERDETLPS